MKKPADGQLQRLYDRLSAGPLTSRDIRDTLDILQPAARIAEIRALGYRIARTWVTEHNRYGQRRRLAQYTLLPGHR